MASVSGTIPNLIGGVSQQPPEIRALNTSTALTNSWSSVVSGLGTRPFTEFIADIGSAPTASYTAATHGIDKPSGRYLVTVIDGSVFVTNLETGVNAPVSVEGNAGAYIATADASADIRFTTIGDTTFVLNRSRVVAVDSNPESGNFGHADEGVVRLNPNLYATHWTKQSAGYLCNYSIYLNGNLVATTQSDQGPITVSGALRSNLTASGVSVFAVSDTVNSISLNSEADWISSTDGFGDQATFSYNDYVEEFTDLPNFDREGRLVMIRQGVSDPGDDYWVWRKRGSWEETYGWNAYEKPDADTMPAALIDNRDGTWTLRPYDWSGRLSGDRDSNPSPTFVGRTINDMFRYKGRLVFLTDENVVMSQKGVLENFYRTTCTQLIDEDRIDIAASESRGASLIGARPFDGGLLVFSPTDQFILKGDDQGLVSPNTVDMGLVNTYSASDRLQPINVGPNVLFVEDDDGDQYARLLEYQIERVFGQQVALPITDQVTEFIASGVYRMIDNSTNKVVVLLTSGDRNAAFAYNYYYNNEGKVQSSWQKWEYRRPIYGMISVGDTLYLLSYDDGRLVVLRQRFSEGVSPILSEEDVMLDKRVSEVDTTVAFVNGSSTVDMPYAAADDTDHLALVIAPGNTGSIPVGRVFIPDTGSSGTDLTFEGVDLTGEQFFVGYTYEFDWTISPFYPRDNNLVVIQDSRLSIRRVSLLYNRSGPFDVHVTPEGRETYVKKHTSITVGSSRDPLNATTLDSGKFRFSAPGPSDKTVIRVRARTPWRVRFSSIEWTGSHRPKSRRTI